MSPPGGTATLADGGNTLRAVTPELLIRDTHRLLEAAGIFRSPRWTNRVVRAYWSSPVRGIPFGQVLAARLELTAEQRRAMNARSELRYVLEYADPTGETAVRHVMAAQR